MNWTSIVNVLGVVPLPVLVAGVIVLALFAALKAATDEDKRGGV